MKRRITRRSFVKTTLAAGAGLALPRVGTAGAPGANDTIRVAVAGVRSKGGGHIKQLLEMPGVQIVALCDPDSNLLEERLGELAEQGVQAKGYRDIRNLLERDDIDALTIATCNHWHALMTVWACQAGKDVYVEKPASHNIWEGRKMVEAARTYGRIVQHGTQSRSHTGNAEVFAWLHEGHLGKILYAHGICYRERNSIGKVDGPQPIPPHIDYDLFTGPAPMEPLMRKNLHYDWHWVWPTGNGEIGNQGPHEWDLCRWALRHDKLPRSAVSVGGRFVWDDDGTTPNTQIAVAMYEPGEPPIVFEVQNLRASAESAHMSAHKGVRVGLVVQCEGGYFAGTDGGYVYDNDGNRMKQFKGSGGGSHMANFFAAVRSRKKEDLHADIAEGHLSCVPLHMSNVAYRLGREADPDEIRASIAGKGDAEDTLNRILEHLMANRVDLQADRLRLGPWVEFDPAAERFTGALADRAEVYRSRDYRAPFVMPDRV